MSPYLAVRVVRALARYIGARAVTVKVRGGQRRLAKQPRFPPTQRQTEKTSSSREIGCLRPLSNTLVR